MFGIKRIDISNFGNGIVPQFKLTELNIDTIHNGFHHNGLHEEKLEEEKNKEFIKKKFKTSGEIFNSINKRYNKFKYAYYNKSAKKS